MHARLITRQPAMPNNGAYNNQAASPAERNVGPVGLTRLPVAGSMPAGVIFQDGFDDQPDWTPRPAVGNDYTTFRWTGDESVLPANWDAVWNSEADATIHNLEITDSMFPGHGRVLRCRRLNRSGGTLPGQPMNFGLLSAAVLRGLYFCGIGRRPRVMASGTGFRFEEGHPTPTTAWVIPI